MTLVLLLAVTLVIGGLGAVVLFFVIRSASNPLRYGSVSGGLMEGRVVHTYGEFPTLPKALVKQTFRVVAVQADTQAAVGLELAASGPAYLSAMPIRLTPDEASQVAAWLEQAVAGAPGAPPGGGWLGYERFGLGASVSGHFGTIEVSVSARHYKLHVVRLAHPTHSIGIALRGTVNVLSTQIVGAAVEPGTAHALAACLRHAAGEATSRRGAAAA